MKRDAEINKSILEWLFIKHYDKSAEAFMLEAELHKEDASKGNKLDKKWGTILSLQKKINDLETQVKQLKEEVENGPSQSVKKEAGFVGLPKSLPKSTIKGHRQAVSCVAFHPFYKRLASGSEDASIIIWECDEFTQERSVRAHSNTVNHITFDNNGKYLASCSADLTVKIWNFDTMTVFRTLNGHEHTVSFIEFMPDGNYIFSASRDKTIKYWEIQSGNCKKTLNGHSEWVRSVSVNIKGTLLGSSGDDENIIIWQINDINNSNNIVHTLNGHNNKIETVMFLKNEKSVVNVYMSDYLRNFNIQLKEGDNADKKNNIEKLNETLIEKTKMLKEKEKALEKDYLLSASRDKTIKLWDVIGGVCIYTFIGHDNWVRSLCEHPSGKYFVSCSDDKSIRLWDLKNGLSAKRLSEAHEQFVVSVSMSPKCKLLASGSIDKTIRIWDCS